MLCTTSILHAYLSYLRCHLTQNQSYGIRSDSMVYLRTSWPLTLLMETIFRPTTLALIKHCWRNPKRLAFDQQLLQPLRTHFSHPSSTAQPRGGHKALATATPTSPSPPPTQPVATATSCSPTPSTNQPSTYPTTCSRPL